MFLNDPVLWPDQVRGLNALYTNNPDHWMRKFFIDCRDWQQDAERRADRIGLTGSDIRPHRVCDVGCGVPYFLAVCEELGHEVAGLDVPDQVLIAAAALMGITYIPHVIAADTELPELGGPYDLITMFGVNLRRSEEQWWTWEDWLDLVGELLLSVAAGGRLVIQPNKGPHCSELLLDYERWRREQLDARITIDGLWLIFERA